MNVPETYKSNLLAELNDLGIDEIWKLRGNVQVLKNYVLRNRSAEKNVEEVIKNIEALLDLSNDLYKFLSAVKYNVSSADFNKLARLLNTGGGAVNAIEEILSTEDVKFNDLLLTGLSMVLTYAGNTAYISSALESTETTVNANSVIVYDKLWNLVHTYNTSATQDEIEKINKSMTIFFQRLSSKEIPLIERITIITRLYQLLLMIYIAGIIRNVNWIKI
jgi:hypothetical protein